jgi:hypothetical protein
MSEIILIQIDSLSQILFANKCVNNITEREVHGANKIERWVSTHGGSKFDGQVLISDFRCVIYLIVYIFKPIQLCYRN